MPPLARKFLDSQTSLFGEPDPPAVVKSKPKLNLVIDNDDLGPLTDFEKNNLSINLPKTLIWYMEFAFANYMHTKNMPWVPTRDEIPKVDLLGQSNVPLTVRPHVFENLMWVMNLYDHPPVLSFEKACYELEYDPELIRINVSHNLKVELQNIYEFVRGFDSEYALRIKHKLAGYTWLA